MSREDLQEMMCGIVKNGFIAVKMRLHLGSFQGMSMVIDKIMAQFVS